MVSIYCYFFLTLLLPLEVSLKLQLILKGNCLVKICYLETIQRYSIQITNSKIQNRQMVFVFPLFQCCVTQ